MPKNTITLALPRCRKYQHFMCQSIQKDGALWLAPAALVFIEEAEVGTTHSEQHTLQRRGPTWTPSL